MWSVVQRVYLQRAHWTSVVQSDTHPPCNCTALHVLEPETIEALRHQAPCTPHSSLAADILPCVGPAHARPLSFSPKSTA